MRRRHTACVQETLPKVAVWGTARKPCVSIGLAAPPSKSRLWRLPEAPCPDTVLTRGSRGFSQSEANYLGVWDMVDLRRGAVTMVGVACVVAANIALAVSSSVGALGASPPTYSVPN